MDEKDCALDEKDCALGVKFFLSHGGDCTLDEKDCVLDVKGRSGGIMSPSLNCRHIIATLRFQLNFQGAFFRGRARRVGGSVGVKRILLNLTKARSALQLQYLVGSTELAC